MTNMTNIDNYAFNSDEIATAVELEQERELDDYLASSEPTADDLDYLREQYKLRCLLIDVVDIMTPILAQYANEDAPF